MVSTSPGGTNASLTLTGVTVFDGGDYWVRVDDGAGSAGVGFVKVILLLPPNATVAEPVFQEVAIGGTATVSVTAYSALPMTYQWFRDGQAIPGAISSSLAIAPFEASQVGDYTVEVSNVIGSPRTGLAARVRLPRVPVFWGQPVDQLAVIGGPAGFGASADGTRPMTFQWFRAGQPITDATNWWHNLSSVQENDLGEYYVEFSNSGGTTRSSVAHLTLGSPPVIIVQPRSQIVYLGKELNLSVSVTGSEPLSYQWFLNGASLYWGTTASLKYFVGAGAAGEYKVEVRNSLGTVVSEAVTVVVDTSVDPALDVRVYYVDCQTVTFTWSMYTINGPIWKNYRLFRDGQMIAQVHPNEPWPNDTGLVAGREYSYQVSGYDDAWNETSKSAPLVVKGPDCTEQIPPSAPGIWKAAAPNCNAISLFVDLATDTGGSGLKGYKVYLNGVLAGSQPAWAANFYLYGLSPSTRYVCAASAVDVAGNESALGAPVIVTTPPCTFVPPPPPPTPPPGFEGVPTPDQPTLSDNQSCGEIAFQWTMANPFGVQLKSYNIFRDNRLLDTITAAATNYVDHAPVMGAIHSYQVGAVSLSGSAPGVTQSLIVTAQDCRVKGLKVDATSCRELTLKWRAPTGTVTGVIVGYNLYRDNNFLRQVLAAETNFTDAAISPSQSYTYSMAPVGAAGVEQGPSSKVRASVPACPDLTPPSIPADLVVAVVSCQQIDLSWPAATDSGGSDLRGYRIFRNGRFLKQTYASETSFSDFAVVASGGYSYAVSAIDNADNESALSSPVSAQTPQCPSSNGVVYFSTHQGSALDAPVNWPDGSGAGVGVTAQLFLVHADGSLVPLKPATEFRSNSSTAAHYVKPIAVEIPGVPAGSFATLRLRAWKGDAFDTAQARGESADFFVQLGGGIVPPTNLDGLRGFTLLAPAPARAPKPPDVATGKDSSLILQHADRTLARWHMDGPAINRGVVWGKLEKGWQIIATGDFDRDGQPDLLLEHTDRRLAFWLMDGDSVREGVLGDKLPDGWEVDGVGDFDGDGQADILLHHFDGRLAFWFMHGTRVREGVIPFTLPTGWKIIATGDFDHDGKSDIVLLGKDRSLAFWFMNGSAIKAAQVPLTLDQNWEIIGTGDFNHDDRTDMVLRNADGWIAFWFMDGTKIQDGVVPFKQPDEWSILLAW